MVRSGFSEGSSSDGGSGFFFITPESQVRIHRSFTYDPQGRIIHTDPSDLVRKPFFFPRVLNVAGNRFMSGLSLYLVCSYFSLSLPVDVPFFSLSLLSYEDSFIIHNLHQRKEFYVMRGKIYLFL